MENLITTLLSLYKLMLFTSIMLLGVLSVLGQESTVSINEKPITVQMKKQPLGLIFRYLIENYDIPIGFEESLLDRDHNEYNFETNLPAVVETTVQSIDGRIEITYQNQLKFVSVGHPITVDVKNGKLEDVFNQIVGQMNNYKWEINDGVINIFPAQGRFERFERLLETKISRYTVKKGKVVKDITANIKELPEFISFLKENNLIFFGSRNGPLLRINAQYGRLLSTDMDFSNITFRELLNKITKTKKGGWILRWIRVRNTGREIIDIDI